MDKHHGHGGTYEVDPSGARTLKTEPTKPTDTGGPRDKDGQPIEEKRSEKPEPALPAPPAKAPWASDVAPKTTKKGA